MSNALLKAVMPLAMTPTEKAVLIVLADAARDDDDPDYARQTWLTMHITPRGALGLVDRTCLGERTVQRSLRSLEAKGHIRIDQRPGRGVMYTVLPRHCGTAATAAPRHSGTGAGEAATPATAAPNPLGNPQTPSKASPSTEKRANKPKDFMPPDWVPLEPWEGWIQMRRANGKKPTPRGLELAVEDLRKLSEDGHPPGPVLDQSTKYLWTGLFPLKGNDNDQRGTHRRLSFNQARQHTGGRTGAALDRF